MDNEARERLHATAALNCLLCGEDKAERIAEKIPQIMEQLRRCVNELGQVAKHAEFAHLSEFVHLADDLFDAAALLRYIDTGVAP